jgi:hypothetical protein
VARVAEASVRIGLIDRLTGPLGRLQARLAAFSGRMGLQRVGAAIGNVGRAFGGLSAGLAASTARFAGLATVIGLGGGGAIAAMTGIVNSTAAVADELIKTSRQLGIGVEALQEYGYAASLSGVEAGTLDSSLRRFSRSVGTAAQGNRQMVATFRQLNVPIRTVNGEMRNMDDILADAMRALAAIEDPTRRNIMAMQLFGRAGSDMTRLIAGGNDALLEMRQEAHALGLVLSTDFARQAEVYNDNIRRMRARMEGLRNIIANQLLPAFGGIVIQLTAWIDANRELIATKITAFAEGLVKVITDLLDPTSDLRVQIGSIVDGFNSFRDTIRPLTDMLGGEFMSVLTALGIYIAGPMVLAIGQLAVAFGGLFIAMATNPIGWIAMAVAALAYAAYKVYENWDAIWSYLSGLWDSITAKASELVEAGKAMALGLWQGFEDRWNKLVAWVHGAVDALWDWFASRSLTEIGVDIITGLWTGYVTAWTMLIGWAETAVAALWSWFTSLSLVQEGAAIIAGFWVSFQTGWDNLVAWAHGAVDALWDWFASRTLTEIGTDIITGLWNGYTGAWAGLVAWVEGAAAALWSWFTSLSLVQAGADWIAGLWGSVQAEWAILVAWVEGAAASLWAWFSGLSLVQAGADWIAGLWDSFKTGWLALEAWADGAVAALGEWFGSFSLVQTGLAWVQGLMDGFASAWAGLVAWVASAVQGVWDWFTSLSLYDVGAAWINGLWDGMKSRWDSMVSWLSGKLDALLAYLPQWALDAMGLSGPLGDAPTGETPDPSAPAAPVSSAPAALPQMVVPNIAPLTGMAPALAAPPAEGGTEDAMRDIASYLATLEPAQAGGGDTQISAPVSVAFTVNGLADVAVVRREAEAAVRQAMAEWERNQRSASQAALYD